MRLIPRSTTLLVAALLWGLGAPALAGMVGTDRVLRHAEHAEARATLTEALERDAVREELRALGVDPAAARARVERMTPAEVARLQGQVASLPAGGALSTVELLLIIILIVLLI
jgi:hypothetical protein